MLILLPPSEGKTGARRGRPVDLASMAFPELTTARRVVGDALVATSAQPDAVRRLTVAPGLVEEVRSNVGLWTAPTRTAAEVYTGVLYAALDHAHLDVSARRRARTRVLVTSALWGAVRLHDRIPAYRLPICADVGLGALEPWWRAELGRVLPDAVGPGPIVDCRSSSYVATWRPTGSLAERWVQVKVVTVVDGQRVAVSHLAKHTRGLVAAALLSRTKDPRSPAALPGLLPEFSTELAEPDRSGRPWTLTVLV